MSSDEMMQAVPVPGWLTAQGLDDEDRKLLLRAAETASAELSWRRWVYFVVVGARPGEWLLLANVVSAIIASAIIVNTLSFILSTDDGINDRYGGIFDDIEAFCTVLFTLEFVARLWTAPESKRLRTVRPRRERMLPHICQCVYFPLLRCMLEKAHPRQESARTRPATGLVANAIRRSGLAPLAGG